MPALFLFLFKVNMALLLFCGGYYLVLRHLTFYTLNRIYLVTAIIFSTLYPKINLSDFVQRHQQLTEPVPTVILNWETPAKNLVKPLYQPDYWQWVEVIFWAGVALFAARMVMQLFSLLRLYRRSQPGQIDEHKVRLLKDDIGPFSFWRSVYVNPTKLSPAELKNVLQHEQIHVSQWHTLDLLLAELSTIFYWFNPGVWLMKKAVRENLEFITDRKILQKGADSKEYQYSLVSVSLAAMPNTIVNHFNISTIKKRIIMMNAKKSSGYNITRYVLLVPAVVVLLLTFSLSKAEVTKHTFKTIATAISHVAIVGNRENPIKKSSTTIKATKPALAKALVKKANINADTIYSGKAKNGRKSFMVMSDAKADSVNYVLNGKKSSKEEVKAIDPERIKSVELLNAKTAKEFYPELDNNRQVMFVTTEDSEAGKKLKEKIDKTVGDGTLAGAHNMSINGSPDIATGSSVGTTMSYTVARSSDNATEVEEETNSSKTINAVVVTGVSPAVKAKTMTAVKNHVYVTAKPSTDVLITSNDAPNVVTVQGFDKKGNPDGKPKKIYVSKFNTNNDQLTIDGEGQPLFIINGKEAKSIKNISAVDIQSISVLKDGTAEKKYGEKGKNGVIEITTKKK
ncbi:M56 family metallopeptidase [Mucilaginibacter sp. BT774]|uniref:M56 family metallopeptidase n=1 Tax=Mucilaginibacter sp. BT774 TaxID=3062276 RepID=UPI0026744B28|nr:M56 family metallopeptidase [Mucilaginibacter sp. BT774]MDO3626375.1 M56 family metallopeptidase [Mucilaginibacter sp. BT774]